MRCEDYPCCGHAEGDCEIQNQFERDAYFYSLAEKTDLDDYYYDYP